jgi:hypothetical protein
MNLPRILSIWTETRQPIQWGLLLRSPLRRRQDAEVLFMLRSCQQPGPRINDVQNGSERFCFYLCLVHRKIYLAFLIGSKKMSTSNQLRRMTNISSTGQSVFLSSTGGPTVHLSITCWNWPPGRRQPRWWLMGSRGLWPELLMRDSESSGNKDTKRDGYDRNQNHCVWIHECTEESRNLRTVMDH